MRPRNSSSHTPIVVVLAVKADGKGRDSEKDRLVNSDVSVTKVVGGLDNVSPKVLKSLAKLLTPPNNELYGKASIVNGGLHHHMINDEARRAECDVEKTHRPRSVPELSTHAGPISSVTHVWPL
jgi:hypothetical protein